MLTGSSIKLCRVNGMSEDANHQLGRSESERLLVHEFQNRSVSRRLITFIRQLMVKAS